MAMPRSVLLNLVRQAHADGLPATYNVLDKKGKLLATVTVEPAPDPNAHDGLIKKGELTRGLDEISFFPAGNVCQGCGRSL